MPETELLSDGLVTTRDPALLTPGEVQQAEDVMLLPGSPSIYKAPGRVQYSSSDTGHAIDGLAYCAFDETPDKLAAVINRVYYTGSGDGITSLTQLTGGAGTTLDTATMLNRTVLMTGASNIVLLPDGTFRSHGMQPVTASIGGTVTTGGGTWPLGADSIPNYYEYWVTEVYKSADEEIESTFTGKPFTVQILTTAYYVTITLPSPVNASTTHWRVYRSVAKSTFYAAAFPNGYLIAELPIGSSTVNDGLTVVSAPTLPTVAVSRTAITALPGVSNSLRTPTMSPWTNPANALLDDGNRAVSPTLSVVGSFGGIHTDAELVLSKFGFTGLNSPVPNIALSVKGKVTTSALTKVIVYLSPDGGVTWTNGKTLPLTTSVTTVTVDGGDWGRTWVGENDFGDGSFLVLLRATVDQALNGHANTGTAEIDFVKVTLTTGGASSALTTVFPAINITAGPVKAALGSHAPPPAATTGDVIQGSLVMNDPAKPSNIVWTIPGTLDYCPVPYRMAFDSGDKDRVTCIRALGNIGIIGQAGQVQRMNYVPLEEDPEFNTGRAFDPLDSDDGIVSLKAACRVTINGVRHLFYVGQNALHLTDGSQSYDAAPDIYWPELVDPSRLAECEAANNAIYSELLVYYPARDGSTKTLRLSYHASHIKRGRLKVAGITNYGPTCAATGVLPNGQRILLTGNADGNVYRENSGYIDRSGGTIKPLVMTRDIHARGIGNSWELAGAVGIHHPDCGASVGDMSYTVSLSNYPLRTTSPTPFELAGRTMTLTGSDETGDGIAFTLRGADDGLPWTINFLTYFPNSLGETNPLKQ